MHSIFNYCMWRKKVYVPQKSSTISNIPTVPIDKDIRVALVLSGGGARAIAHLGVLEVLEENKIPVDLIIATSGGSIVGALYADNPNAIALKSIVRKMDIKDFVDFSILSNANMHSLTSSFADGSNGEKFLLKNMRAKDFKDLKMPFIAVATDIESGQTIGINNGPVAPAVRASYSIPGLFPPVQIFGMTLVDGGVTAPLGVDIAKKSNAKMIIAVDVTLPVEEHLPTNVVGLVLRSLSLNYHVLNDLLGKQSDILIKPQIRRIGMFDAHKKDELFELGRQAALKKLPEIKKHLLKKRSLIKKLLLQKTI
ncbi:MAG UNVERIFIED_CONTAM: patatin-like phospholipase family protein [Rickettsiaceae bacterium]